MPKDVSYIQVPSISYITVDINSLKQASSPIATGSATNTTSSTTEVAIDNAPEAPTTTNALLAEIEPPTRRAPARVLSSDGGSGPTGLGDTTDSGPDNSRLGSDNSDTPTF